MGGERMTETADEFTGNAGDAGRRHRHTGHVKPRTMMQDGRRVMHAVPSCVRLF